MSGDSDPRFIGGVSGTRVSSDESLRDRGLQAGPIALYRQVSIGPRPANQQHPDQGFETGDQAQIAGWIDIAQPERGKGFRGQIKILRGVGMRCTRQRAQTQGMAEIHDQCVKENFGEMRGHDAENDDQHGAPMPLDTRCVGADETQGFVVE